MPGARRAPAAPFFETPLANRDFIFVAVPVLLSLFLGWRGLLLNLVFALGTSGLIYLYRRKLGGITGDLLGAMTEVLETVLFLAVCVGGAP